VNNQEDNTKELQDFHTERKARWVLIPDDLAQQKENKL
jgi:hypothetical protein